MNKDFGWAGYKNLSWVKSTGLKLYEGTFKKDHDSMYQWTEITIRFWSNHPKKAMSYICQNSRTIEEVRNFEGKEIIF